MMNPRRRILPRAAGVFGVASLVLAGVEQSALAALVQPAPRARAAVVAGGPHPLPSAVDGSVAVQGGRGAAATKNEVAEVVPAIYSWDPAVRFLYYRHVSKWM